MRFAPVSLVVRWTLLAYLALVLGWVAPAHHHVVGVRPAAAQPALVTGAMVLDADASDPACEVCAWKGQPSLDRGLPAPAMPACAPTRELAPPPARASPVAVGPNARPRAPPVLVA